MSSPTLVSHAATPGGASAMASILSSITSFAVHGLPVVQFIAAVVAIVTGAISAAWVIKRWRDGR